MKRRDFLKGVAAAGAAGAAMGRKIASAQAGPSRPNVLVIHTDQQRIDCLGAYGETQIRTPHVDAIAADGVRFTNSFCSYPVCTPSRYSLISGLPVHAHRGWSNYSTLPPGTETFPSILRAAGYRTKAVGKMHFTPTYLDLGFDELELSEQNGPGRWDDDYHRYLRDRGLVDYNDLEDQVNDYRKDAPQSYRASCGARVSNLPDEHHSTTWIGDRAVETLRKWDSQRPNLLMVGFIKPHHPFDPPASWAEAYNPDKLKLLPGWTPKCLDRDLARNKGFFPNAEMTEPALRKAMAYYYAMISQIDHHVGRMIEVLKKAGLYDNTLIVYTSDHGDYMGFHHMLLKGNNMYDPLVKVPLIVKFPGGRNGGKVSDALVSSVDVATTILRGCGLAPAKAMRGLDLATEAGRREVVFTEDGGREVMARTKTRKLILRTGEGAAKGKAKTPAGKGEQGLFFDLEKDPLEMTNLYDDPACQEEIRKLTKAIEQWRPGPISKLHLDENAPVIRQPNVPPRDDDHREKMMSYCREMMRKLQTK